MGNPLAEKAFFGVLLIDMQGVPVPAEGREHDNVGFGHGPRPSQDPLP
jgi:hypothetical protein